MRYFPTLLILLLVFNFIGCQPKVRQAPALPLPPPAVSDETAEDPDFSCAYFYFLWGRQAELAMRLPEALEAYEKALICDPDADYIVRKIPVILLRMNRGEEAVALLRSYLERKPQDTGIRMLLARVYIGLARYDEAAEQYQVIHRQDRTDITSLLLLSELYLNQNKLAAAEETLLEVLRVDSEAYPAHVLLGRIYLSSKRLDLSLAAYEKALALNWSPELLLEKADVYRLQERYEELNAIYRKILEDDPGNEPVALALIHSLLLDDKEDEALAELERLKARVDHSDKADQSMARFYVRMKKYEEAIELLRSSLSKNSDSETRFLLAVVLTQTEQYDKALAQLRLIGKDDEEYENAVSLQVRILRFMNKEEQAIELLERVVQDTETRSPDMFVMLAALYQLQNQTELGRSAFDRAMVAFPEDEDLLYEFGLFLDTAGRQDEAMSVMQQVIERQPEHGEALNYVGYSWADKSINLDKALAYIRRAVELRPENGYVRDSLGWVYYRLGRYEEALAAMEEAVRLAEEEDPTIFEHLGDVYFALGRQEEGLVSYRKALSLLDEGSVARSNLAEKIKYLESREKK
ncbi:MAG: tetratricopeptide repeat protein [Desulfobulbaceae bacterium]